MDYNHLRNLNAIRLFLQVATLADISSADGKTILNNVLYGQPLADRKSLLNWPRQPSITATQTLLWRKALLATFTTDIRFKQQCNGIGPLLRQPLGAWIDQPNQEWCHYYDSAQQVLLIPSVDGTARSHPRLVSRSSRTLVDFASNFESVHFDPLNPHLIPSDVIASNDVTIKGSFHTKEAPRSSPSTSPYDQTEYQKSLPAHRRRLLSWCRLRSDMRPDQVIKIIREAVEGNVPIEFGSDGGLNVLGGTFGYVMGMTEVLLWDGAGPVDGDMSTASSTRSELFGYASTLEFLLLLKNVYKIPVVTAKVITWMDSLGALSRLAELSSSKQPTRQYPDNADVLSHIAWLWESLPEFIHIRKWVKAHQDSDRLFKELPWNARLNVMADSLATAYYDQINPRQRPLKNPLFFPSCRVSLLVNGQRITAKYDDAIRFHINGTSHRQYLQKTKPAWHDDSVWNSIDFEALGLAFTSLTATTRTNISKLLHGWMNTGVQRAKFDKHSSSSCPRCGQAP